MQVSKWGNSLAIRLPAAVVDVLDLKEGDDIEVCVDAGPSLAIRRKPAAKELLARLRQYRGSLPADFKFDRLEANARGAADGN
ncbi:AbrB/MazE/SpoVT family DNA-binding domain-containing protein [Ideonella sp. DXS22W]|uniref:AbrB/MazE/SpoVT family DNA-binding domain-containing protein n=1 Tax=Pseudaquabacterium inlustre TaxID=2984192 RepID=A0ABU9CJ73_9BURK